MPQIVQARMWAQGLTIGIIIAAGVLTHSQRAKAYDEEEDHRFRHVVSVYFYMHERTLDSRTFTSHTYRHPIIRGKTSLIKKRRSWPRCRRSHPRARRECAYVPFTLRVYGEGEDGLFLMRYLG